MAPNLGIIPDFIVPPLMGKAHSQVSHETVSVQTRVRTHWIAPGIPAAGGIPYRPSYLSQYPIEHLQRGWLGVIGKHAAGVPPRSDVEDECAGELAFESAEDAACLVSEMGAVIHAGRDAF